MPDTDIGQTTTTDLTAGVPDFQVKHQVPDAETPYTVKTTWEYPNASKDLGYFKTIPQYNSAIKALATWTVGKGFTTDAGTQIILENMTGWGEDSIQSILFNLIVMKKALGDSFAEIIRNNSGTLINLKPLYTGNMRVVVDKKGFITGYEDKRDPKIKYTPQQILHLVNDRIANEIHGTSTSEAVKWIIDAKEEVMRDWRKVSHRSTIRVMYIDTDNAAKLSAMKTQYKDAIKNGELLIITVPKGGAELTDLTAVPIDNFMQWMRYLDNLFYQTVGVPKIIATSEDFTEAGGKVGFLTFEPVYTREQVDLESDLWNQCAIRVKFNRPPTLSGMMQESEDKNTGQTGIQPSDTQATITRNE